MSIAVYRVVHMIGLILLFQSLGATLYYVRNGGSVTDNPSRKMLSIMHGVGLILILIGGFGMLAKLGVMSSMPLWVWVKIVIYFALGGSLTLVRRNPASARLWWILTIVLGAIAATMGSLKPF